MSERWLLILTLAAALILPIAALMRRRIDLRKGMMMALVWIAIFLGVAWLFKASGALSIPI